MAKSLMKSRRVPRLRVRAFTTLRETAFPAYLKRRTTVGKPGSNPSILKPCAPRIDVESLKRRVWWLKLDSFGLRGACHDIESSVPVLMSCVLTLFSTVRFTMSMLPGGVLGTENRDRLGRKE